MNGVAAKSTYRIRSVSHPHHTPEYESRLSYPSLRLCLFLFSDGTSQRAKLQ